MKLLLVFLLAISVNGEISSIDKSQEQISPVENPSNRHSRIMGGEVVPHSIPWQVYLNSRFDDPFKTGHCGGTIISTKAVLTTARCVSNSIQMIIIAGAHQNNILEASQQRQSVPKENYRVHPSFVHPGFTFNIAILITPKLWIFNQFVQSVLLPTDLVGQSFLRENATISGWGFQGPRQRKSNVLRAAIVPVISNEYCEKVYGAGVTNAIVCTGTSHGQGACGAENGGPLTVKRSRDSRPVLIGTLNFVNTCGSGLPQMHSRTTAYLEWINKNI